MSVEAASNLAAGGVPRVVKGQVTVDHRLRDVRFVNNTFVFSSAKAGSENTESLETLLHHGTWVAVRRHS
jgi:hypothetical protein